MNIDHIGIVVKSLAEGIIHWQEVFGYTQQTEEVLNTRQKVRVVFMVKDDSLPIKLIEPADENSSIYRFARRGGGLHHLCFRCGDVNHELEVLREKGLRILVEPQPGEAFENGNIAFLYAGQGLNIELIDTYKRRGVL